MQHKEKKRNDVSHVNSPDPAQTMQHKEKKKKEFLFNYHHVPAQTMKHKDKESDDKENSSNKSVGSFT